MIEIGLIIGGGAALLLWLLRGKGAFSQPQITPISDQSAKQYKVAPSLFVNASERAFFQALRCALPQDILLMSKVRMEDIVGVHPRITDDRARWHLRGRVKSRHVDFLITDLNGRPLRVVELDGAAHGANSARINDSVKDAIFAACALPVLRVKTGDNFARIAAQITSDLARYNRAA